MEMASFLLILLIAFILIVMWIAIYMQRVASSALTDQFRAAESISNGSFPDKWFKEINRRQSLKRLLPRFQPEDSAKRQALQKIDKLIRYFEKSPFFENAAARDLLLLQLKETRQHWINLTWDEIEKEYISFSQIEGD